MKLSELAKELGYKTSELTEIAKRRSIDLSTYADLPPQMVALVRAKVPPASKLQGDDLTRLKELQAIADAEKARRDEERQRKAEEKARKEAERAAKRAAKEARAKEKAARTSTAAQTQTRAPAPAAPVKVETRPAAKHEPRVEAKELGKGKITRRRKKKEVEIAPGKLQEPAKIPEAKIIVEAQVVETDEEKLKKPVIALPEPSKEVRVLRPFDLDKFSRDAVKPVEGKLPQKPRGKEQQPQVKIKPKKGKPHPHQQPQPRPQQPPQPRPKPILPTERKYKITPPVSVRDFSEITGIKISDILRRMMDEGLMLTINSTLDEEQIVLLGLAYNRDIEVVKQKTAVEEIEEEQKVVDKAEDLSPRPPIVTVMGHVDHGKTSLLDKIRKANVAEKEFGGITQHIGAYQVKLQDGKVITFLDTPGHEAFTQMRARGANVTDIAIIVVAADEGVMPQTEEAISHARAAGVTIMVAVNKIDKPGADLNKVRGQLSKLELVPEEYGGQTIFCDVSAVTGQGVDHLLEMILLQAEILELKANPKRPAHGRVLEARKSDQKGPVATLLVQNGTLRRGDIVACGTTYGRIRAMEDEHGNQVQEAGPSTPVMVLGLTEVPEAGAKFSAVDSLEQAQSIAEERAEKQKAKPAGAPPRHVSLETLFSKLEKGAREVRLILKTDVRGSGEALLNALDPCTAAKEVSLKVIHNAVGAVSESDVILADASDAIILGFNVSMDDRAEQLAKERGVQIRVYNIIYELVDHVKAAMEGKLEPERVEEVIGTAEVRQLFKISRLGTIAGCMVKTGKVERNAQVRVVRNGRVIFTGKLDSLKRFKDDVKEVAEGYECGIKVAGFDTLEVGDILEAFVVREIARKLF